MLPAQLLESEGVLLSTGDLKLRGEANGSCVLEGGLNLEDRKALIKRGVKTCSPNARKTSEGRSSTLPPLGRVHTPLILGPESLSQDTPWYPTIAVL